MLRCVRGAIVLIGLAGCTLVDRAQKAADQPAVVPAVPTELPDAQPADQFWKSDADVEVFPELMAALPWGPRTPVVKLVESQWSEGAETLLDRGIVFTVDSAVASLTAHALQRQLELVDSDALVYLAGPSSAGRTRIAVLTVDPNVLAPLTVGTPPTETVRRDDVEALLNHWHEATGLRVFAVDARRIELELDTLPKDVDAFLGEVVELTEHSYPNDEAAAQSLRLRLLRTRQVTVGG